MGNSVMGEKCPLYVSLYDSNALPETEFKIGKTVGILLTSAGIMWIRPSKMKGCDGECQREGCKCHRSLTEWCAMPLGHFGACRCALGFEKEWKLEWQLWNAQRSEEIY